MKDILEIIGIGALAVLIFAGYILLVAGLCLAAASPLILIVWLIAQAATGGF